ncbi:hypothetical protein NKDENANG_03649 [Candidatus Entotheonellaceae bacterium PAL068K]
MQHFTDHLRGRLRYVIYLLGPLLAAAFLCMTLHQTDLAALWASMIAAKPGWVLLAFLTENLAHVLRAHRWRYLLGEKYRSLSLWPLWSGVILGYGVSLILPRIGEVGRPLYLARVSKVSVAESLATVCVERFLDLLMLPVLFGLSSLAVGGAFVQAFDSPLFQKQLFGLKLDLQGVSVLILLVCAAATLGLCALVRYYDSRPGLWLRHRLPRALATFLDKTIDGFTVLRSPRAALAIGIDSLLIWASYALAMYLLTLSIDLGGRPANGVMQSITLLTAAVFGVMFPTPGGLGPFGFAVSLLLHTVYAVPQLQANAYALLANVLLVILPVLLGSLVVLLVSGVRDRAVFELGRQGDVGEGEVRKQHDPGRGRDCHTRLRSLW